ncbi:MAG: hypothetical protein JXA18_13365 [Chitinispirillaceae bacterium]|nr:hypothetical protein [Chitinispirillaceae bacterium]
MELLKRVIAVAIILTTGCGVEFSTRYDRIEGNRVRPLAFVYDNHGLAEGAPGDSVWCTAYFAGEPVTSIDFSIATSLIMNQFGRDTFADTVSLDRYMVPGTRREFFGGETDSIRFQFVVPETIVRDQFAENATIGSLLPPGITDDVLPDSVRAIKPSAIIDVIEGLFAGELPSDFMQGLPDTAAMGGMNPQTVASLLPMLLQVLTVDMKLFATINNFYRMESIFSVRYNSRFTALIPAIPVNHNPAVGWIRCCRIKGDNLIFDPTADSALIDTIYELFPGRDTIQVDVGYRYFLVADTAPALLDSGFSLTDSTLKRDVEEISYEWFFENSDTAAAMSLDSLVTLGVDLNGLSVELLPSVDTRLTRFNLWLVTYDDFFGERLRPVGFEVKCIDGVFGYSDAYIKRYR